MDLKLIWHKPIKLKESKANLIYELDLDRVPSKPGVYIFMRSFGRKRSALYIGKASKLKSRIKGQRNNLKLMKGIQRAAIGRRVLVVGEFMPKPGQNADKCLPLIEQALIRHFLSEGHDLLNIAGTHLATHSINSEKVTGHFIPNKIYFE